MAGYRTSSASGGTSGTGNRTSTIVVSGNDLLVHFVKWSGNAALNPTCTDDLSPSAGYDLLLTALNNASADMMAVFVRQALVVSGGTATISPVVGSGSNTAGEIVSVALTGVTKVGSAAIRGSGKQENQTTGAPNASLPSAALSTNLTVMACGSSNLTGSVPNSAWIERQDIGQITPSTWLEVATRDSGFTGVTAGFVSTASNAWCSCFLEVDARTVWTTSLTEAFSLSDSISRAVNYLRTQSEAFSFVDSIVGTASKMARASWAALEVPIARPLINWSNALVESFSFSDTIARLVAYTRTDTEAFSLSDSISRAAGKVRSVSEAFSFADAISRSAKYIRMTAESFSFADVLSNSLYRLASLSWAVLEVPVSLGHVVWTVTLTEAFSFSDSVSRLAKYLRTQAESFSFADVLSRSGLTSWVKSLAESFTLTDAVSRLAAYRRTTTEVLSLVDALTRKVANFRTQSEASVSFQDWMTRNPDLEVTWTDSTDPASVSVNVYRSTVSGSGYVVIANVATGVQIYKDFSVSPGATYYYVVTEVASGGGESGFSPEFSATVPLGSTANYFRTMIESFSLADAASRAVAYLRTQVESFSFVDSVSKVVSTAGHFVKSLVESFTFSDVLSRLASYRRTDTVEVFFLTDQVSRLAGYVRSLPEAFVLVESISRVIGKVRTLTEAFSFSDSVSRLANYLRLQAESFSFADVLSRGGITNFVKSLVEAFAFSDSTARQPVYSRLLTEAKSTSDALASLRAYVRVQPEAFAFSDSVARAAAYTRALVEAFTFSDILQFFNPLVKDIVRVVVSVLFPSVAGIIVKGRSEKGPLG